jgi:hypothetical protein
MATGVGRGGDAMYNFYGKSGNKRFPSPPPPAWRIQHPADCDVRPQDRNKPQEHSKYPQQQDERHKRFTSKPPLSPAL